MQEAAFRIFLENDKNITSEKARKSRIAKLKDAEKILGKDADSIVRDDEEMRRALIELRGYEDVAHSVRQNALRKYYKFINGTEFPKLADC